MRFQRVDPAGSGDLVDVDGNVPPEIIVYVQAADAAFTLEQDPRTGIVHLEWLRGTIQISRPNGSGAALVPTPAPPLIDPTIHL